MKSATEEVTLYGFWLDSRPAALAREVVFGKWYTVVELALSGAAHFSMLKNSKVFSPLQAYVLAVILLGGVSLWIASRVTASIQPVAPSPAGILTFMALGIGLELARHRLRQPSASGSVSFVVLIAAGLIFGPLWGAVIAGVSMGTAQLVGRRPPLKIVFNTAQCTAAVVFGTTSYVLMGGQIPPTLHLETVLPYIGFVLVFFLFNSSAVSGAIALHERRPFVEVWVDNTLNLAEYDLIASVLGLGTALLYVQIGLLGVIALVIPILFIRHTYAVNIQLQETNRELLDLMVKAIEARDPYTSGHSQRVAELARGLAKGMRLGSKEVESIGTAALLHDVGKIYEEFAPLLRKEGKLTPEERALMQSHPARSAELVGTISSLHGTVYKCVRHHHENFDGSGYPDGLAGRQIPSGARIIMVADTVDAMTTDRPYRKALPFERVVEELKKNAGRQFDPEVVQAFCSAPHVRQLIGQVVSLEVRAHESSREKVAQFAVS